MKHLGHCTKAQPKFSRTQNICAWLLICETTKVSSCENLSAYGNRKLTIFEICLNSIFSSLPYSVNSTHITCRTVDGSSSSVMSGQRGEVNVNIDGTVFFNGNVQLEYVQPMFGGLFDSEDVNQEETLLQG